MNLEVQVVGRSFREIEKILIRLNESEIPTSFSVTPDIEGRTPQCYVGEVSYKPGDLEKIKRVYWEMISKLA